MKYFLFSALMLSSLSLFSMNRTFSIQNESNVGFLIIYPKPYNDRNEITHKVISPNSATAINFVPWFILRTTGFPDFTMRTNPYTSHLKIKQPRPNVKRPGELKLLQKGIIIQTLKKEPTLKRIRNA